MGWRAVTLLCLSLLTSGCSVSFVSAEYAARPVQPLNAQAALAEINTYRKENGVRTVVLDARSPNAWLAPVAATQVPSVVENALPE